MHCILYYELSLLLPKHRLFNGFHSHFNIYGCVADDTDEYAGDDDDNDDARYVYEDVAVAVYDDDVRL
jgi:hypothetical protein